VRHPGDQCELLRLAGELNVNLRWSVGRASLILVKFDAVPLRQLLNELVRIEWKFGNIHAWLPCGFGFRSRILDAGEREGTALPSVRVFQHPQLMASPHDAEHALRGCFWVDVPSGERKRRTVSLGLCATQWVAHLRLREYIERAGVCSKHRVHQIPVPGSTFRQRAEWWMDSLFTRRRRPLKPATVYGWRHCLDRWILPNLANKLVSEVGNGALGQFVEVLSAAGLAPKTIVNVVTVVKFVVASAVDEEGDQIHPRVWNYEFIQLPLVIKEKQSRPAVTEVEVSGLLNSLKERYAVLVALVAGTGLRIGEASQFALRILARIARSYTYGEASGTDASKHRKRPTRSDSSISRRDWHEFYADTRKEGMAAFSRREPDGFLTNVTHSRRCTGQGIEVDSAPFGAFALRYFAGEGCPRT